MFNDERERALSQQHRYSMSIQAWAAHLSDEAQGERVSPGARMLLGLGDGLIAVGSMLRRLGSPKAKLHDYAATPRDRAYS